MVGWPGLGLQPLAQPHSSDTLPLPSGHVANFVETEQLLAVEGPATHPQAGAQASGDRGGALTGGTQWWCTVSFGWSKHLPYPVHGSLTTTMSIPHRSLPHQASFVEVRGSIPLLWTQLPNIKYKPNTVIAPSELSGPVSGRLALLWNRKSILFCPSWPCSWGPRRPPQDALR